MLKRKISDYLESYFTPNRREALLITGARQVGKSYAIREFGKSHYSSFIEINLLEDSIARTSISKASNSKDLQKNSRKASTFQGGGCKAEK